MFENCKSIEERMNKAERERAPFLFGFNFDLSEGFFVPNPLNQSDILFDINGVGNSPTEQLQNSDFRFDIHPEPFERYKNKFDKVMRSLRSGDVKLVNLTIKTPITTSLGLKEIFRRSRAKYKLLVPDKFVCFSPECFVKVGNGKISSFPMKGTIDAHIPDAEWILLSNPKEIAEHEASVKQIEADLSQVASSVQTKRFRYVERLDNHNGSLLQVSSEVEGELMNKQSNRIGSILLSLLPAGSIAGVPKQESLQIIREAEQESRGYYSGIFGYFDGVSLDTGVMIRFIEKDDDGKHFFRSGGGITANSDCETEYSEAIAKIYLPIKPR